MRVPLCACVVCDRFVINYKKRIVRYNLDDLPPKFFWVLRDDRLPESAEPLNELLRTQYSVESVLQDHKLSREEAEISQTCFCPLVG